jgi:signal transduction histidine kinase/CheY-like chemotaxis protein
MPASSGAVPTRLLALLDWIAPPRGRAASVWRRRMLALALAGFALLALVPYAAGMYVAVSAGDRSVILVDTIAYALLLTVVFARRAPFAWRAGTVLAVSLLVGAFLLTRFGPTTSGYVWLLVAPIMASVFFTVRVSLGLLALEAALLAWIGSTLVSNTALWPVRQPGDVDAWLASSTSFLAITLLLSYSIATLFKGLAREAEARQAAEREADRQQQLAALGTIATAIAHDVNNLLQPLLSDLELLRHGALDDGERAALLDRMVSGIDQARGLTRRAQQFARPTADSRVPIDLARVVPETVRAIRAMVPTSVQLRLTPVASTHVLADAAEIQRLLVLLVANAAESLPPGGSVNITVVSCDRHAMAVEPPSGAHRITFGSSDRAISDAADRMVMIQVHDDGAGMTPTAMTALRASIAASGSYDVEVLGLATVQETVEDLGGILRLCSRVGDGSCAEVFLPEHDGPLTSVQTGEWRLAEAATTPLPVTAGVTPVPPADSPANAILVVADEPAVLQATGRLLERMGYRAVCTSDPLAVEGMLPTIDPPVALVLSDVHMPGLDGWQLADRLRASHPQMPVVMMSGHADSLLTPTADHPGVVALVAKPFTSKELGDTIALALQ